MGSVGHMGRWIHHNGRRAIVDRWLFWEHSDGDIIFIDLTISDPTIFFTITRSLRTALSGDMYKTSDIIFRKGVFVFTDINW